MGICASHSDAIDKDIPRHSTTFRKECKILLLGTSDSGKSTIVKQMKVVHHNGFSQGELLTYRVTIYKNLVESAQAIILAMRHFGIDCETWSNRLNCDRIVDYRIKSDPSSTEEFVLDSEIANFIHQLWKDSAIPKIMDHSSEFYLMDSASYFFSEALRIGEQGYVPTETDVIMARQKSTGITESRFNTGQLSIQMFDVGGVRSERKKWIHCFGSVTSIIFCAALSEYDQVLFEERNTNRMAESLVLFESVLNSKWFVGTSIILFLNKIDVFKSKLRKIPLERYFPEYTAGPDFNKAVRYILSRFMQANRGRLNIYPHLTQATNTTNIRGVFAAVEGTILQKALKNSGIL